MAPSSSSTSSFAPTDRKRVIGELTRGREIADQLRLMLRDQTGPDAAADSSPARGLVGKVLGSFTRSISMLRAAGVDSGEVSQPPAGAALKPEYSGESCKRPAAQKDRRGCYKRRKSAETWTKESPTLIEDGYAWRKYGQKSILNAKHPRNYFRCTHKFEQGCQASKQVQMTRDDPPMYQITYHGEHTCKKSSSSSSHHQIVIDDPTPDDSPVMWSFAQPEDGQFELLGEGDLGIDVSAIEQEDNNNNSMIDLSDHGDYFGSSLAEAFSSGSADHGGDVLNSDVLSCTTSNHDDHALDIDIPLDSIFEQFFCFQT